MDNGPKFLRCLGSPRNSVCNSFFTLRSGVASSCIFDIVVGLIRIVSLVFRKRRPVLRIFHSISGPLVAIAAGLCMYGLIEKKLSYVQTYWKVKILDAAFALIATAIYMYYECKQHDCNELMFFLMAGTRVAFNLFQSHLAWSAAHYLESGQQLLVMAGPAIVEMMEQQEGMHLHASVTIVEGQTLKDFEEAKVVD